MLSVKLAPIAVDIQLLLDEALSPKAQSAALAAFAREELQKAEAQNTAALGHLPDHETYIDHARSDDSRLEAVRPDGVIMFEFTLLDELFAFIGEQLVKHSPVGKASDTRPGHPGLYMASHVFLADGVVVEPGAPLPQATDYVFASSVPYARKLEKGLSDQHMAIYEGVAALAAARFGNIAKIKFTYASLLFGDIQSWARTTKSGGKRRGVKRNDWLTRQPAIMITPR